MTGTTPSDSILSFLHSPSFIRLLCFLKVIKNKQNFHRFFFKKQNHLFNRTHSRKSIHHVFFVDEVAGFVHQLQHGGDVRRPVVEHGRGRALLREGDGARAAVDLGRQLLGAHHLAQKLLRALRVQQQQLRQAISPNVKVFYLVRLNQADLMLV